MIRYDPTLEELTSNFFNVKVFFYIIIHSGWSLEGISATYISSKEAGYSVRISYRFL